MTELTKEQLLEAGFNVLDRHISLGAGWNDWRADIAPYYPNSDHKVFELYVSFVLAVRDQVQEDRSYTLIDVAADRSPFAPYAGALSGMDWYKQDLSYVGNGVTEIGGDAADIPESFNGKVDSITLNCAFEHFEGDADINFVKNIRRLLAPGGVACILPFYSWGEYVETPPQPSPNTGFGRFYSVDAINDRIVANLNGLDITFVDIYMLGEYRFRALILKRMV